MKRATNAFFGLSVGPNDSGPAVVVNTWDRISVERWIFTAAHELGHILLHQDAFDRSRSDEPDQEEEDADQFASHFLMPDAGFNSEWEESRGLSLLNRVLKIKRIYRVSYKTVLYRLMQSGLEDQSVWRSRKGRFPLAAPLRSCTSRIPRCAIWPIRGSVDGLMISGDTTQQDPGRCPAHPAGTRGRSGTAGSARTPPSYQRSVPTAAPYPA